jgi:hypothetical protein
MRFAVVSFPRTGSTHLGVSLAMKYELEWLLEPLTGVCVNKGKRQILQQLMVRDNYVVKFMSHNFFDIEYSEIDWKKFDKIYVTYRENLTDGCISHYVASIKDKWHRFHDEPKVEIEGIVVPETAILEYSNQVSLFNKMVRYIKQEVEVDKIIFYEYVSICSLPICRRLIPTELNYRDISNYDEVEQKVRMIQYE